MGVLEIFDRGPGDILWLSRRYLIDVLEIFALCFTRFLIGPWRYLMGVLEIFNGCDGVFFYLCPGDI